MAQQMNSQQIAQSFCQEYYGALMQDKTRLLNFYTNNSTMSYGGMVYKGIEEIKDKIESFSFGSIQYKIHDMDVQDGPLQGSMLIFIVGALQMDGAEQFNFSQVFNVLPNGSGGFYIHNDIFRTVM